MRSRSYPEDLHDLVAVERAFDEDNVRKSVEGVDTGTEGHKVGGLVRRNIDGGHIAAGQDKQIVQVRPAITDEALDGGIGPIGLVLAQPHMQMDEGGHVEDLI